MSLIALIKNKRVLSIKYDKISNDNIICPGCKNEMIFVNGIKVIKHFRHKIDSNCEYSESLRHIEMKKYFIDTLDLTIDNIEVYFDGNIADVYLPKLKIVIEVQHSQIPYSDIIERTIKYNEKGIHVLWVFDFSLIKKKEEGYMIPIFIRETHYNLYHHRFYTLNNNILLSIHLSPVKKWVEEYYNSYMGETYGGYFKTLKTRFDIKSQIIFGLNNYTFEKITSGGLKTIKLGEGKYW